MTVRAPERALFSGFLANVESRPEHSALEVGGQVHTYGEIHEHAASLAATLQHFGQQDDQLLVCVLGRRSRVSYAAVLGITLSGHGYVSLNPKYPLNRLHTTLSVSKATAVIVDQMSESLLEHLVDETRRIWILPESDDADAYRRRWPDQVWIGKDELRSKDELVVPNCEPDDIAYVLFTSGSTGEPKGVVVTHGNVNAFVDGYIETLAPVAEDRFSQMPELSFDASVSDLWVCWEVGGTLCIPSDLDQIKAHDYIIRDKLTVWTFVPSLISKLHRLDLLKPNIFPNLRITIFGGEILPHEVARAWSIAAPNSIIENHYGPTECTVTSTRFRWSDASGAKCAGNTVPIGYPMPRFEIRILDEDRKDVEPGDSGELFLAGPQVARGYWDSPDLTGKSFQRLNGSSRLHYRTGDHVIRTCDKSPLRFLGRFDDQVQIRGHRVEVGEVETVIREVSGFDEVVVLGWPECGDGSADGLVAFIQGSCSENKSIEIRAAISEHLPDFMRPRQISCLDHLPVNANGKIDRNALRLKLNS
jgi:amino acid adenylation domain-containing protein